MNAKLDRLYLSRLAPGLPSIWASLSVLLALVAGAAVVLSPPMAVVGAVTIALACAIYVHPPVAAYVLLVATPLTAGIDRGLLIPVLRPNEAIAMFVGAVLALRGLLHLSAGKFPKVRIGRVDASILFMAVASSILPLMWMAARGKDITQDDVLHSLVLWKYYGIYLIVRFSIRAEKHVGRCLYLSMAVAGVVAVIAILQSLKLFGVPQMLATYYSPFGMEGVLQINRGSATLALAAAVADLMTFNLAIAAGWLARTSRHRTLLFGACVLFVLGTLASGQISGAIALVVGAVAIGVITQRLRPLLAFVPSVLLAGVLLRPVIERRLSGFETPTGLPPSWEGRIYNLTTYFWPELFSRFNFLLGVRPSARVMVSKEAGGFAWIESGHTWLLWSGGIPLFIAFFFFLWVTVRKTAEVARTRTDAIGVAAIASFVSLIVVAVLMTVDPHLTYRGSADVLFSLLALACTGAARPGGRGQSQANGASREGRQSGGHRSEQERRTGGKCWPGGTQSLDPGG